MHSTKVKTTGYAIDKIVVNSMYIRAQCSLCKNILTPSE